MQRIDMPRVSRVTSSSIIVDSSCRLSLERSSSFSQRFCADRRIWLIFGRRAVVVWRFAHANLHDRVANLGLTLTVL